MWSWTLKHQSKIFAFLTKFIFLRLSCKVGPTIFPDSDHHFYFYNFIFILLFSGWSLPCQRVRLLRRRSRSDERGGGIAGSESHRELKRGCPETQSWQEERLMILHLFFTKILSGLIFASEYAFLGDVFLFNSFFFSNSIVNVDEKKNVKFVLVCCMKK